MHVVCISITLFRQLLHLAFSMHPWILDRLVQSAPAFKGSAVGESSYCIFSLMLAFSFSFLLSTWLHRLSLLTSRKINKWREKMDKLLTCRLFFSFSSHRFPFFIDHKCDSTWPRSGPRTVQPSSGPYHTRVLRAITLLLELGHLFIQNIRKGQISEGHRHWRKLILTPPLYDPFSFFSVWGLDVVFVCLFSSVVFLSRLGLSLFSYTPILSRLSVPVCWLPLVHRFLTAFFNSQTTHGAYLAILLHLQFNETCTQWSLLSHKCTSSFCKKNFNMQACVCDMVSS